MRTSLSLSPSLLFPWRKSQTLMSECRFGLLLLIVSLLLFFPPVMRCASIKKQASIMLPSSSSSSSFGFLASGFYFVWSRLTFVSAAFPWLPPHCAIQVASVDNNRSMVCERVSGKEAVCQAHALQDACPAAAFCPEGGIPLVLFSLAHIRFPLFGARSFPLLSLFRRQRRTWTSYPSTASLHSLHWCSL